MSKKLTITSIVIIIILAGGIGYFVLSRKSEPASTPQTSTNTIQTQPITNSSPKPKLTIDILKNSVYTSNLIEGGKPFKFIDGIYQLKPLPGESQEDYWVKLDTDHIAFGDLNNDEQEDAAVIIVSRSGGTGTFREVAVVLNQNGIGNNVAGQYLGDRTVIHSLTIKSGTLSVDMTPWGSNDTQMTINYTLSGNKLFDPNHTEF